MKNKEFIRMCPVCGNKIYHLTKRRLNQSIKEGNSCKPCSKKGINNPNFGIKQSLDICLKKSQSQKRRYTNKDEKIKTSNSIKISLHRPDIRKRHLDALFKTKYIGRKTDKGQLELIEKWNQLGFNFEPNYQVKTDVDLFYIDGYDGGRNVVLEYDTKYHNRRQQREKDLVRQNKIIELLKPKKFWRFNSEIKQFVEVIGENNK